MADEPEVVLETAPENEGPSLEVTPAAEIARAVNETLTAVKTEELRSLAEVMKAMTEVLEKTREVQEETQTFLLQTEELTNRMEAAVTRMEELLKPKESGEEGVPGNRKLKRPKYL